MRTTSVYRPGAIDSNTNRPSSSAVASRSRSRMEMWAPGTGKMASLTTTPETAPRMSSGAGCCSSGRSSEMRVPSPRRTLLAPLSFPPQPASATEAATAMARATDHLTEEPTTGGRLELCRKQLTYVPSWSIDQRPRPRGTGPRPSGLVAVDEGPAVRRGLVVERGDVHLEPLR